MADQPTISNSDLSEIAMFNNIFDDRTVTLADGDVLAKHTVLGTITATGFHALFASAAVDGTANPRVVLMQALDNTGAGQATDFTNIRVMLEGELDGDLLVFDNGTDTLDTLIASLGVLTRDALKTEGLIAVTRNDLSKLDNQ